MAYAEISTSSFSYNLALIKQFVSPDTKILLMCKANAYGHGLSALAPYFDAGGDGVGLTCFDAAVKLRSQGFSGRIVMMQGFSSPAELQCCIDFYLTSIIHHESQIRRLAECHRGFQLDCWIKINTGMCRLGFSAEDFKVNYLDLLSISCVNSKGVVVVTHLSSADDADRTRSQAQLDLFSCLTTDIEADKSVCNSAALFAYPNSHHEWVRPGLALYGVSPFLSSVSLPVALKPVMTLKARVVSIGYFDAGECLGYGATYQLKRRSKIAVINIGYGDGYPRDAKAGTPVLVRGQRCRLLGRVSMDMITVDVTDLATVDLQDEVILWGTDLPIEEVARESGCFVYEMLTGVTSRVKILIENNFQYNTVG
jgi:alanine racemase